MGPGFESLMVHHIFLSRGIAQLVEQRSPKPRAEGSNPSAPARVFSKSQTFCLRLFCLSTTNFAVSICIKIQITGNL